MNSFSDWDSKVSVIYTDEENEKNYKTCIKICNTICSWIAGPPVEVLVSMFIVDISSVSEVLMVSNLRVMCSLLQFSNNKGIHNILRNVLSSCPPIHTQDFTTDFYFRQIWTDSRLSFDKMPRIDSLSVGAEVADRIWVPDTFFANEKSAYFHVATTPNTFLRINHKGEVFRSMRWVNEKTRRSRRFITFFSDYINRLTVTASCPMELQYFPMDRQLCTIEIESCKSDLISFSRHHYISFMKFNIASENSTSTCKK